MNGRKSPAGTRQKLGLVWRIRKKISQIFKDYFYLPFFLLIILWPDCCPAVQGCDPIMAPPAMGDIAGQVVLLILLKVCSKLYFAKYLIFIPKCYNLLIILRRGFSARTHTLQILAIRSLGTKWDPTLPSWWQYIPSLCPFKNILPGVRRFSHFSPHGNLH